ncbi:electron transport complex protein [Escherichia coli]|nr:hypothetical protein [Escherichia coli]EFE8010424.1 hypothetical protein [Escherichia coli]SQM80281.1 electron transport complex protein [Escherichia coli]SQN14530.1 electron transport complex protein [Escherichia coli]SQO11828.1 electron transport complex protein [Escherichia coli]
MVFRIASSPYTHNQRQTSRIMLLVLLAAVPGIAAQLWLPEEQIDPRKAAVAAAIARVQAKKAAQQKVVNED